MPPKPSVAVNSGSTIDQLGCTTCYEIDANHGSSQGHGAGDSKGIWTTPEAVHAAHLQVVRWDPTAIHDDGIQMTL